MGSRRASASFSAASLVVVVSLILLGMPKEVSGRSPGGLREVSGPPPPLAYLRIAVPARKRQCLHTLECIAKEIDCLHVSESSLL